MILRLVILVLATISVAMIILGITSAKKYEVYVSPLNYVDYQLKDLFCIGFFLNSLPPFSLRGDLERELKNQSRLYLDNVYYEYYATLAWAEFLTYSSLIVSVVLCFAGLMGGSMGIILIIMGGLFIAIAWNVTISKMEEAVDARREECEYEFPTMVSKLALMVSSGMISRDAWYAVAYGKEGELYDLMRRSCEEMNNGASEIEAIHHFGVLSDSNEIRKFTSTITQSLERGGSDLAIFLLSQTSELWNHKRQLALQRGEVAAGKLVIPLGIMFAGILFIIMSAAMQGLSL